MNIIKKRSNIILFLTIAFFAGLLYHTVNIFMNANEWVLNTRNWHLTAAGNLDYAGSIYDRRGNVLAYSSNGERYYNDDESIRKACFHVIGDDSTVNLYNSVQNIYRSELIGSNFLFSFGMPKNLRRGRDINLTIDADVQKAAYDAIGDRKGAVFFYNYRTGAVLCMVSTPVYDPENIPSEDALKNDEQYEGVYINRVLSGRYAPGSTFKLVTAAAGLENIKDVEKVVYDCKGTDKIGGEDINCEFTMGSVDMTGAIVYSCNCYFGHLASETGRFAMTRQAEKMGFNRSVSFDGFESAKSVYDVSEISENEFAWSGVGQANVLETPLNVAMISAAIANGGVPVMPYIVSGIGDTEYEPEKKSGERMMSEENAQKLADMMDSAVSLNYGKQRFSDTFDVCAKTGTAEVADGQPHAWITGFCRNEDCPLAFAVVIENGGSGYSEAIPVAAEVLRAAEESLNW